MHLKNLFIGLLGLSLSFASSAKIVESVSAVVEGQMILKSDISSFQKRLRRQNLINENLVSFLNLSPKSTSQKEALDYLIAKKIIIEYAKKDLGISNLDNLISTETSNMAKQNKMSVKQLEKAIRSRGIDFSDYKNFIGESSLIRSALEKNVISQVRPTEDDFVSYLKQNGVKGIVPSYVYDLDQIFIPKTRAQGLEFAKEIKPENFKDYFSSANKLKVEATKLGNLKSSELSASHSRALSEVRTNEISSIIKEKNGYRIFYVNQRRGNFNIPNTKKVRSLQQKYYDSKIKTQFSAWFNELKPQFFVRINK